MRGAAETDAIEVKLFADLRDASQAARVVYPASRELALLDLLTAVCTNHQRAYAVLRRAGVLRSDLIILVNGRSIAFLDGPTTPVGPGDEVAVFPPMAGG